MIRSFRDLKVYQKAYALSIKANKLSLNLLPKHEMYELGSQLRRSTISIPLNIAEGYGRKDSAKEFKHFLRNALGSCNEVQVILEMLKDLGYIEEKSYQELTEAYDHVGRQLYKLIHSWE